MHEMSLVESMLTIMEEQAKAQGFEKVKKVWLEVGELSHAEPEALTFCFEAVMKGSLAEGAELEIIRTKGKAWCMDCAKTVTATQRFDACPECGSYHLQVTQGDELRIKELEVD